MCIRDRVYADQKAENGQVKIATPLRITLVDTDGAVLYDSEADEASMGNHKNREEIKEALKYGEGNTIRHSETIGDNTIYYEMCIRDRHIAYYVDGLIIFCSRYIVSPAIKKL